MNNYNGGGFKKGAPKFGGQKKARTNIKHPGKQRHEKRDNGADNEQFSAVCSECGKTCQVPFRPSSDKPVYCSVCFGMKKSANESRDGGYSAKKPRPSQSASPEQSAAQRHLGETMTQMKRQMQDLDQKLNRILDIINPPLPAPVKEPVEKPAPVAKPKKAVAKKAVKKVAVKKTVAKKAVKKVTKKK